MRIRDLWFRIRTLLTLRKAEREMSEEFAFHMEMETQKLIAAGFTPQAADAEARRRFGGLTRERQRARDQWGLGLIRDLASDTVHAFRQFKRRPGFTAAGMLTLALGIGATTSLFSVVRGTLLRPLPVAHEEQLHIFWSDYDWRGVEFDFLRPQLTAFSGIAAYSINGYTLGLDDGTVTALAGVVSAEIFDVLGAAPALGHTFEKGDDRPGAEPRVMLSWGLWQRRFGGDTAILGKRVMIDGAPATVIGVMPKRFYFPTPEIEMWRPLDLNPASRLYQGNGWLVLIARAKPNVTDADINANIQAMAKSLGTQFTYPAAWDKTKNAHTTLLRTYTMGAAKPALLLLLGAVVALLLMACANVAALVLSRTTDRAQEMTLRTALGANGGRLARQIVAESLALSTVSGLLGVALAAATFGVLVRSLPLRDALGTTLQIDWSMFAGAIVLAAVVGLLVAAVPVRSLLRGELRGIGGERSGDGLRGGHKRFHFGLVATEMALGVTLAAGALLLVRSVSHLYAQDTGFNPAGVVTLDVLMPRGMAQAEQLQTIASLEERARAIPGVTNVGFVSRLPVRDGGGQTTFQAESRPDISAAAAPNSFMRMVTPGYLDAMGIRIVKGRGFTDADRAGAQLAVIVSESFAKKMWPDKDPINQRIAFAGQTPPQWMTVVGVAAEARLYRMVGDNPLCVYFTIAQAGTQGLVLVAKTNGSTDAAMSALRGVVHDTDRRAAVGRVITMSAAIAGSMSDRLQLRFFLTLFAALALVLGAIGVYGVVSYAVSRRRAEFGVRMALGATSQRVMSEVAAGGLRPVVYGVLGGVLASAFLSRFVASFLFGVGARDVISIGGAALALLLAGVMAVVVPGVRAGKTSPMEVLRGE